MPSPWQLIHTTHPTVLDADYEVAVLPVGATEPHGRHITYGSDVLHTQRIAEMVCERAHEHGAKVVLLPILPYGVEANQRQLKLSIHVPQSTLNRIVTDIVRSVENHGLRKLVIFNGHGGNDFKPLLRDLYGETSVFLSIVNWWTVGTDVRPDIFEHPGDHGDEMETSVMLALHPECVDMAAAGTGEMKETRLEAINRGWVSITRPWHLFTVDAGAGDPRRATAEKGRQYLEVVVQRVSDYLVELSAAEMNETFPY